MARAECWVSVDTETSGPGPSTGSLLSVGACLVDDPEVGFYAEVAPSPAAAWSVAAEKVHRLTRAHLAANGRPPAEALGALRDWTAAACGGRKPVFLGFNTPFDWMYVADQFWLHLGANPFGTSAPDIKSIYYGARYPEVGLWSETSKRMIREFYPTPPGVAHTHNALDDAREQAQLARAIFADLRARRGRPRR